MKTRSFLNTIGVTLIALSMVACGSSGGGDGTSPNMTLGITSLGSGTTATKPSFASNVFDKTLNFFSTREAMANNTTGDCNPSGTFLKITDTSVATDMIWITKAYAILDEFEFEDVNSSSSSSSDSVDDNIQWAIDLLNNDPNVDSNVPLVVPVGLVANAIKFKIQRLEDNQLNLLKGVTNQADFLAAIGFGTTGQAQKVRPSVYLKGSIMAGGTCHTFQFITDARFRTKVPFASGNFDPASVKGVLQFDIVSAFKNSGITVAGLAGELGAQVPNAGDSKRLPAGDYLDGRTKDPTTGSTNAVLWAKKLVSSWEVFTKPLNSDNTLDTSATHISGSDGNASTDDNPSASDLDNPTA